MINQRSIFPRHFLRTDKSENHRNQDSVIYHAQREYAASIGRYQQTTRTCLLQRYRLQGLQRSSRVRVR